MGGKNSYDPMVAKNQWDKIMAKMDKANAATKIEIAEACSRSSEDESMNILIRLLTDADTSVQTQAIKSLGMSGRLSTKTHLFWLSEHLAPGKDALKPVIKDALAAIAARNQK